MKKNVLLILTDQQRKDSLGCYGNPIINTPSLDKLSEDGVRFNKCYVANPICMPNRLSIFTGMYPRNHGLWTNGLLLNQELRTLASELSDNGYETASFGKIHFEPYGADADSGSMESTAYWEQRKNNIDWFGPYWGFNHVELTIGHTNPVAHYIKWFEENGGTPEMLTVEKVTGAMMSGVRNIPKELHDSNFVSNRTVEFIKKRDKNKPFFAVASFPDPHHPFDPPRECAKKYANKKVVAPIGSREDLNTRPEHYKKHFKGGWHRKGDIPETRPNGVGPEHEHEIIANTYAMVDLIDENIGKITKYLEEENLIEDTIIIFTSDHGELLGDHGLWYKGPFFYDGLVNVPLIVSCPGFISPYESNALISSVDIFPTICDLIDVQIPNYVVGVSHKEHLFNHSIENRDKCLIEYRNGYGSNDCSSKVLVTKDYKYVRYQNGESELTDIKKDPEEKINVAHDSKYAEITNKMNECLLDEILSTENKYPEQLSLA
ncbi:MAG: sulfatase [Clostridiaceae bacterium]